MRRDWRDPVVMFSLSWIVCIVLVWEEVTLPTLVTMLGVIYWRWNNRSVNQHALKLLGLALFGLAFLKHGRHINPEMGFNLLLAVVSLKLLEAKGPRDWRMLTLGTFLVWATGALFVKTPLYFLCTLLGSAVALMALVRGLGETIAVSWRELWGWVLKALPLSVMLFFLLPRFSAGLWTPPPPPNEGEVGFAEDARPGDVSEIRPTGELAFHATVTPLPSRDDLYWRGLTLTGNDGWNWYPSPRDESWQAFTAPGRVPGPRWWQQDIIHKKAVRRAFALEVPQWWMANNQEAAASENGTLRFPPYRTIRRYSAVSAWGSGRALGLNKQAKQEALMGINRRKLPAPLNDFQPQDLNSATQYLSKFFQDGFAYTLSAGRVSSLRDFLTQKRGWCVHYASSTAIILRAWDIPARLVSGYLGGEYNEVSNNFSVSEDDAHVWVEAWNGESWERIDPTLWIAPERVELSGAEFFRRRDPQALFDRRMIPGWIRDGQLWLDAVNYRFLVWSEEFDRDKQTDWAEKLDWDLSTFYMAGLWVLLAGILGFWGWELWRTRTRPSLVSERERCWRFFTQWCAQWGFQVAPASGPLELRAALKLADNPQALLAQEWLESWEKLIYAGEPSHHALEQLLKKLKTR